MILPERHDDESSHTVYSFTDGRAIATCAEFNLRASREGRLASAARRAAAYRCCRLPAEFLKQCRSLLSIAATMAPLVARAYIVHIAQLCENSHEAAAARHILAALI